MDPDSAGKGPSYLEKVALPEELNRIENAGQKSRSMHIVLVAASVVLLPIIRFLGPKVPRNLVHDGLVQSTYADISMGNAVYCVGSRGISHASDKPIFFSNVESHLADSLVASPVLSSPDDIHASPNLPLARSGDLPASG